MYLYYAHLLTFSHYYIFAFTTFIHSFIYRIVHVERSRSTDITLPRDGVINKHNIIEIQYLYTRSPFRIFTRLIRTAYEIL